MLTRALAASPLKLLNPRNAGTSAWAYLVTFGGGLVGGDALRIDVDVLDGSTALLATQASTKVYRSERGASQELCAHIAGDGVLVMLPDPVTCFAGARYFQEQRIHMDRRASLVLVDRLTAGRVAFGERWAFHRYVSRTHVWRGGRRLLHDALALTPEDGDIARRMGRFNCLALVVAIGPAIGATATRLLDALGSAPISRGAEILCSAAPLEGDGVLVRIAAQSVEQVAVMLRDRLSIVTSLLGDDPWAAKW